MKLFIKAKDRSKLSQKKITITRGGKTFQQTVWVRLFDEDELPSKKTVGETLLALDGMTFKKYSDKAITISGDTKEHLELIRKIKDTLGVGVWGAATKQWFFPIQYTPHVFGMMQIELDQKVEKLEMQDLFSSEQVNAESQAVTALKNAFPAGTKVTIIGKKNSEVMTVIRVESDKARGGVRYIVAGEDGYEFPVQDTHIQAVPAVDDKAVHTAVVTATPETRISSTNQLTGTEVAKVSEATETKSVTDIEKKLLSRYPNILKRKKFADHEIPTSFDSSEEGKVFLDMRSRVMPKYEMSAEAMRIFGVVNDMRIREAAQSDETVNAQRELTEAEIAKYLQSTDVDEVNKFIEARRVMWSGFGLSNESRLLHARERELWQQIRDRERAQKLADIESRIKDNVIDLSSELKDISHREKWSWIHNRAMQLGTNIDVHLYMKTSEGLNALSIFEAKAQEFERAQIETASKTVDAGIPEATMLSEGEAFEVRQVSMTFAGQPVTATDYRHARPKDITIPSEKAISQGATRPAFIPDIPLDVMDFNSYELPMVKIGENSYACRIAVARDKGEHFILNRATAAATVSYYKTLGKVAAKKKWQERYDRYVAQMTASGNSDSEARRYADRIIGKKAKPVRGISSNRFTRAQMDVVASHAKLSRQQVFQHIQMIRKELGQGVADLRLQQEWDESTFVKGRKTSYSGESGTVDTLYDSHGVKVKRQNGDEVSESTVNIIKGALDKVFGVFGHGGAMSKNFGLTVSYSADKHMHASKFAGLFIPSMKAIGVTGMYGKGGTGFVLAHEWAHFMDNYGAGKYKNGAYHFMSDDPTSLSGKIASTFRDNMAKSQDSDYQNRTCECFARAFEQYFAYKTGKIPEGYMTDEAGNHPTEEVFKKSIMPLIDEFINTHKDLLKSFQKSMRFYIVKK